MEVIFIYEELWEKEGEQRLEAISMLKPFVTDYIHRAARKSCLRCPLAIRWLGEDNRYHTSCTDVIGEKRALKLLSGGGRFLKKGEY